MAYECLKELIFPLINKPDDFKKDQEWKYSDSYSQSQLVGVFHKLFDVLIKFQAFDSNEIDEYAEKVKQLVMDNVRDDCLKDLLREFMKNGEFFYKNVKILELFEIHLNRLKDKLKQVPIFSWAMEGGLYGHPKVNQF